MKFSVLSIAALVAPALGNPANYWHQYVSRPIHPENAGSVNVNNFIPYTINVDVEPQGYQYKIQPGQGVRIPGAPVADVKFNGGAELSYVSGDQGTFNYVISPIGGGFAGCITVSPQGCGSQKWCSGDPPTHPVTCPAGTELPVILHSAGFVEGKTGHECQL